MVFTWNPDAPVSLKAIFVTGFLVGTATLVTCVWCSVAIIFSKKLRKPLWFFRVSLCMKDIILCVVVLLPNLLSYSSQEIEQVRRYHSYLAASVIAATSSSIFTLLCASFDRYRAATRPFRYHMGELMPNGVAATLIFNCWMMGIITAICGITDYSEGDRHSYGVLLQLVSLKGSQKAILLTGLTFVYCTSAYLLVSALLSVAQQKRESRLRLESGQEEPIRSTRNSFSEEKIPTTSRVPGSDSESDVNKLFLQIDDPPIGVKKKKRKWSLTLSRKMAFFTPITFRPSIIRRIRNTWYLYVVVITWTIAIFTTMGPFYYVIIGGEYCKDAWNTNGVMSNNTTEISSITGNYGYMERITSDISAHCVLSGICECLMLIQGLICVLTYVFADDAFRPRFLWPIVVLISPCRRCLITRGGSESTYSAGRKRTLSRNSNIMSFSL